MSALEKQVDGHHYTDMKLQPLELTYMLGETPAFCKLAKYLTREKNDKFINIDKASHCIRLEQELKAHAWKYSWTWINRFYWKTFKKDEIHPYIKQFTQDVTIRNALHSMFLKNYEAADFSVSCYKTKIKEFKCQ